MSRWQVVWSRYTTPAPLAMPRLSPFCSGELSLLSLRILKHHDSWSSPSPFLLQSWSRPERPRQLELHPAPWGVDQGEERRLRDASSGFSNPSSSSSSRSFPSVSNKIINVTFTARCGSESKEHGAENSLGRRRPAHQARPHRDRLQEGRSAGGCAQVYWKYSF